MLRHDSRVCPLSVNLHGTVPSLEVKTELSLIDPLRLVPLWLYPFCGNHVPRSIIHKVRRRNFASWCETERNSIVTFDDRNPVEMSFCVESLLPYHTATASALMTSMLSISGQSYGWLSDGTFLTSFYHSVNPWIMTWVEICFVWYMICFGDSFDLVV